MNAEEILKKIEAWANYSNSYLSTSTDYAKGYKDGLNQAKSIVLDFIAQLNQKQ